MHTPRPRAPRTARTLLAATLLLGSLGTSCSKIKELYESEDGPGSFQLIASQQASTGASLVKNRGRWLVFQASEALQGVIGTDFNQDGDLQDLTAVVVNVQGLSQTRLDVAVEDFDILGDEIYLVVDEEEDSRDWNVDGMTDDLVLLHWSANTGKVVYVDEIDASSDPVFVVTSSRIYYITGEPIALVPETSLRYLDEDAPLAPIAVLNGDFGNTLDPELLSADEDLVFLAQDETVEGRDLNGDGDTGDKYVLGLLDATDAAAPVRSTGLTMSNQNEPLRAMARGPNDWLVAFLVDEAAQGTTNFNDPALFDPAWLPTACVGLEDTDDDDSVLFYVDFAAFASDPVNNPPVNTGLTGSTRIVAAPGGLGSPGFIGTLSLEFDENSCALNDDGDGTDVVFRFTEATTPVLPITDPTLILALDVLVPGGTLGLVELEEHFLIVVDEAKDGRSYDNKSGQDNSLLGWIDPSLGASATYTFDHSTGGGEFFAGVSWLRASEDRSAVLMALEERALGQPLSAGDTDINDSVPVVVNFDPDETDELIFVGPAIACDADDAGMSLAGTSFLYKVDEVADGRDWDLDGDSSDIVFLRTSRTNTLDSKFIGRLLRFNGAQNQDQLGPNDDPLAVTDGQFGGGFLINEGVNSKDLNNDQDTTDRVVQFFRF